MLEKNIFLLNLFFKLYNIHFKTFIIKPMAIILLFTYFQSYYLSICTREFLDVRQYKKYFMDTISGTRTLFCLIK